MVTNTAVAICAWRTKKVVHCNLYLPVPSSNNLTTLLSSLQSLLGILHYFCCAFIASRWPHIAPFLLVESVPYRYLFSLSRARLRTAASSTARQAPILRQVRSPPIVILLRWETSPVWLYSGEKPPQCDFTQVSSPPQCGRLYFDGLDLEEVRMPSLTSQSEGLKHLNNNTAQPSSPQEKEAFDFITSPKLNLKDMSVELIADNSYATCRKDFTMVSSVLREGSKNLFKKSLNGVGCF